ncbi:MAG: hypothetical protein ACXVJ7_11975 [Acidimicrobiia bacterium]
MAGTQQIAPVGRHDRRIERDSWAPTLGPGMVLGALGTIGLVVSMFMSWRTGDVHPSGVPFAFLFDSGTTAHDPSILLALIPFAVLLAVGTAMPRASAARLVGAIGVIGVVVLFAVQLNSQLDKLPDTNVGDVLDTGYYVAAISALVALVSGFLPSGWMQRRSTVVDDGIDLGSRDIRV